MDRRDLEIPQVPLHPRRIVSSHDGEDSSESEVIHGNEFLLDPLLRHPFASSVLLQETLDQGLSEVAIRREGRERRQALVHRVGPPMVSLSLRVESRRSPMLFLLEFLGERR